MDSEGTYRKIQYLSGGDMTAASTAPYGLWKSPISAATVAEVGMGSFLPLTELKVFKEYIYWIERKAAEGGRQVVVQLLPDGSVQERISTDFNARTTVHEYGGGSYCVFNDIVFFSNYDDQRIYRVEPGSIPSPLTPKPSEARSQRYADSVPSTDGNWLYAVREDHISERRVVNELVAIPTDGHEIPRVVVSGNDFYSSPKISQNGQYLAWLTWNHPQMPWNGTELWMARLDGRTGLTDPQKIAGGPETSVFQPEWSQTGSLYFISDASGWWNLYAFEDGVVEQVLVEDFDIGYPQWIFGISRYTILSDGRIAFIYSREGENNLAIFDPSERSLRPLEVGYNSFMPPYLQHDENDRLLVLAGNAYQIPSLVRIDPATAESDVLREAVGNDYDPKYISSPQNIEFSTFDEKTAFAFFYQPINPLFQAPDGERPPLIVKSHGGPTSAARCHLQMEIQYWTSRGFAVVDVNYGGSTGFGRAYRTRLEGMWGIVDTNDCISAARHLVEQGWVDGDRLVIRGGSAGGFTTLSALTFHDVFAAGASYYGVPDLKALALLTHKFEAHYLDQLLAPLAEAEKLYDERSPINHTNQLSSPMILLQGLEDKVVLPSQTEMMIDALNEKGLPYAYIVFDDEAHGFRKKENVIRSLEAEYSFYLQIFGMQATESEPPIVIHNLS
jgi:dipeptidyl aminopeptidase/acylaminoacyl peptidase